MVQYGRPIELGKTKPFTIKKIAKSGSSRYLSVGTILPPDWEAVKVFVEKINGGVCILRLEQIK